MTDIQSRASGRVRIVTDLNKPNRGVTASLSAESHAVFDKFATEDGISMSALGRKVLMEYIAKRAGHGIRGDTV